MQTLIDRVHYLIGTRGSGVKGSEHRSFAGAHILCWSAQFAQEFGCIRHVLFQHLGLENDESERSEQEKREIEGTCHNLTNTHAEQK